MLVITNRQQERTAMEDRRERKKSRVSSDAYGVVVFRHRDRGNQKDIKEGLGQASSLSLGHTLRITDLRCPTSLHHNERLVLIGREVLRQQRDPRQILKWQSTHNE